LFSSAKAPAPTVANFETYAQTSYDGMAAEFLKLYPAKRDDDVPGAKKASREDQARVALDLWCADQQKGSSVVYTYFFDRPIPWPAHPEFGAFHTAEVPHIFKTNKLLDRPWEPVDFKLAEFISSYWVNFAKTGGPNGPGLPNWPAYKVENHTTMELGEHTGAIPEADPARLKFFLEYLKRN
jgi:para-nitrobenzyl esterase